MARRPLQLAADLGEGAGSLGADAAKCDPLRRQALVRIVGPQRQAELGPRGEHAVGFGDAMGRQIVDHHAEVGFRAVESRGRLPPALRAALIPATAP